MSEMTAVEWKNKAEALWKLLDDIDTLGDMIKPEVSPYFTNVNKLVGRRFQHLHSDGYNLFPPKHPPCP